LNARRGGRVARRAAAALAVLAWLRAPAAAAPGGCSRDALTVDRTALSVILCAQPQPAKGEKIEVAVTETFAATKTDFTRTAELQFLAGAGISRTIDNVALTPLGIGKTLHLTLVYDDGIVRLEHALLLPGAVTLK
jgi:hypothetical protein